jgi:hypothetical protein
VTDAPNNADNEITATSTPTAVAAPLPAEDASATADGCEKPCANTFNPLEPTRSTVPSNTLAEVVDTSTFSATAAAAPTAPPTDEATDGTNPPAPVNGVPPEVPGNAGNPAGTTLEPANDVTGASTPVTDPTDPNKPTSGSNTPSTGELPDTPAPAVDNALDVSATGAANTCNEEPVTDPANVATVVSIATVTATGPATLTAALVSPLDDEPDTASGAANTNTPPTGNTDEPNTANGNTAATVVFAATATATDGDTAAPAPELALAEPPAPEFTEAAETASARYTGVRACGD